MLPYLHPIFGGAVVLTLAYAASLGLRMRAQPRDHARLAARHARLAAATCWLMAVSWISGTVSTIWLRNDLGAAESLHFRLGSAIVLLLSGSALTARWMTRGAPQPRELHPWLGAAAALLAAAHTVAGLRITP